MESVINKKYLNTYSEEYATQVSKEFFAHHQKITGNQVLELTPLKQINLMIIRKLLHQWKNESEKLKSPYFNYDDPEVRKALDELMNVLSRHIEITERSLKPLLRDAVSDTLMLIFSPYEFFHAELGHSGKTYNLNDLKNDKKFIRINADLYEAFLSKIESHASDTFSVEETRKIFNIVCEEIDFEPDDPDPYIDLLNQTEPIYLQKIYKELNMGERSGDQLDTDDNENQGQGSTVKEQFQETRPTLADELEKEPTGTVLHYHQKQKIESIRKNISIHQKFMFVKELFQNDENEFFQVIEFLDGCESRDDALEYLENNYFNPGLWHDESEAVIEFMTVIDKKFI